MHVDPDLFIVEVGTERAKVAETFQSSIDIIPPPPQPLRLFTNTIHSFHFIYVRNNILKLTSVCSSILLHYVIIIDALFRK